MKLSEVTMVDGRLCAQLINLLSQGRWDLSGKDIAAHTETVQWVHSLAKQMAEQLKPASPSPNSPSSAVPAEGFKVKSMGKLPTVSAGRKSKAVKA